MKSKYVKLKADIDFIKCSKREAIISTFAKVNLSSKSGGYKLKKKIAKLVMDTELADKHRKMTKLRKQIRDVIIEPKCSLSLVLFHAVIHQAGIAVKSKIKCIKSRHEKKLDKFRQRQLKLYRSDSRYYIKNIAHNFSLYVLPGNEELALAYGLEQQIPVNSISIQLKLNLKFLSKFIKENITYSRKRY